MAMMVARPERKLICNTATGAQFLGRESNSHYHAHMSCLKIADATFSSEKLIIPAQVKTLLNPLQKIYLTTCIKVPFESLN